METLLEGTRLFDMNSHNWRDLSFPVKILKDNYVLPSPINKGEDIFKIINLSEYISDDFFNFVHSLGLYPISVAFLLFRYSTGYSCPIHIDDTSNRCSYAINVATEETDSRMEWFAPKSGIVPTIEDKTENLFYREYDINDLVLIDTKKVHTETLVRTDIPHRGINFDKKDRWCFSIRFVPKYTFEEAEEIFKKYLT